MTINLTIPSKETELKATIMVIGVGGAGGQGGNGGGGILLMAQIIVFNSGAVITADGEDGEDGAAGAGGTSGSDQSAGWAGSSGQGGGGGEGGQIVLLYNKLTNSGTFTVTGGARGDGGPAVSGTGYQDPGHSAASNGQAGSAGLTTLTQVTN